MIILGGNSHITLWDMRTGRQIATLEGHGGWVAGLALSVDGRTLASTGNDGTLKLWDLALKKEAITFPAQISPWSQQVAFAPDGNSIATLSLNEDRLVRLFHAPSMKEIEEVEAGQLREMKQPLRASPQASAPK
jgi:WD40 repeat protein